MSEDYPVDKYGRRVEIAAEMAVVESDEGDESDDDDDETRDGHTADRASRILNKVMKVRSTSTSADGKSQS